MSNFDRLVRIADDLYSRHETGANPSDLSLCIVHYRSALTMAKSSTALSDDLRGKLLGNLANALSIRFQRHGDIADLNHSVECHLTALDLRPPGHPGRPNALSNFATTLLVRYGHLSMQGDIELAIKHFSTAVSMLPSDVRLIPLMNYASALFSRFQHSGDVSDLTAAICQYRDVAESAPAENRSTSYYNLANALLSRFKLENDPEDLELCIRYSAIALHGMSNGHPDHLLAQSCFGTALIRRFELYGTTEDLESAVEHFKTALELLSTHNSAQSTALYDLADALIMRYKLHSDLPDLELAIQHYRTALRLLSPSHKDEGILLDNLGSALSLRFSRLGSVIDLEEAIQKHHCASAIHPKESSRRVNTLEALGTSVDVRFQQFRDPEDLDTAINLYDEVLVEISHGHPRRASVLSRSAGKLETRFRLWGGIVNLDRSISYCREALELLSSHHSDRVTTYQVLISSLILRFEETGDEFDLDEAYLHCSTCVNLPHASDSTRAACNMLLARILKARILPWEVKDIESIFQHLHFAKDLCTLSHPLISDVYAELASMYYLRFLLQQRSSDFHDALGHHQLSMNVAGGSTWPAFRASLKWVRDAETYGHRSGIDIYRNTLRQVYQHVVTIRSAQLRRCVVRRYVADLAYNGASFALRFGEPMDAVETLEGGRSILWSHLVQEKTCLDELRLMGKHAASLADEYERLCIQFERPPHASKSAYSSKEVKHLLKEKEAVTEQIRRIEGFRYFLKPTPYSELDKASIGGPVVIMNASLHACDALLLVYSKPPLHVPLSRVTPLDVSRMAARFQALTQHGDGNEDVLERLLADLWDLVVSPIVEQLLPYSPKGSRLWWCPTSMFTSIPLHAAGPYMQRKEGLSHIYVSSYTPTLQALIRARSLEEVGRSSRQRPSMRFLKRSRSKASLDNANQTNSTKIVAMGFNGDDNDHCHPGGGGGGDSRSSHIHAGSLSTCRELDLVRNHIPFGIPFRRLEGKEVTSDTILAALQEPSAWLHLACPTSLETALPCRSGFATSSATLSLYDISRAGLQAEFAFLSGRCMHRNDGERKDTGAGLEETMHLATSLQYCGVRSVVGTLWPVDDKIMRRVVDAFYEKIVPKAGGSMHCTNAAWSLNEALKTVGKGFPLAQRIAFVHVGI